MNSCPTPSPHTCLFHSPNLPISVTRNMRTEGTVPSRTTIHPPSFRLLAPQPAALLPSPYPQQWLTNFPFPNQTSALPRLSYTPASPCRRPPRSSISTVCVSQADGQFPLLAVFSGIGTWMSLGLLFENDVDGIESHHRVADDNTPSQISSSWSGSQ